MREACRRIYAGIRLPDLSEYVVPGITDLLPWLSGRDGVTLGLLTGNFEPVARLKLKERAGIGRWFAPGLGAFGSILSRTGLALPAIARRRARAGSGRAGSGRAGEARGWAGGDPSPP